jgi:hypothetical protein
MVKWNINHLTGHSVGRIMDIHDAKATPKFITSIPVRQPDSVDAKPKPAMVTRLADFSEHFFRNL